MKILQPVVVKQVLTENSKEKLLYSYHEKRQLLQKECDQLRFELKKLERTKKFPSTSLKNHFEKEINNRQEKVKLIEFQIEQLNILPLGSEITEQNIQSVVEIKVGDDWGKLTNERMIIVKDGFITEIR
ncbi:YlqD family protein [Bacillus sp. FJAT-49736]|uniref:YlqD family protein n=1 Tax=Bacillus sp. FJAT-49736 TaxID=2833582 RepID=UPI001BC97DDE|nr:YlqD family protein [Bacillus sp. FJAT-49736]MBS4172492.1 YlqD family protein [Bacillus sp. FJAT-49736]